ncbi:uncharacterized protein [Procambarus clarkii]|uniref:uncharacterized protein isoform X1 n=2 Tax=Procambarus clarkii TaxID=6728 RepID=UPI0037445916
MAKYGFTMAGIMERVFPVGSSLRAMDELRSRKFSPVPTSCIIGPPCSMKTALLMQAAVTEGAGGGQVLFVAPKRLDSLPPSVHGMPRASTSTMNNIKFLYANHTSELQGYLASLHMIPAKDRPTLIIIDDLHYYTTPQDYGSVCTIDTATQMANAARLLSLAQESAEYCNTSRTSGRDSSSQHSTSCQCSVLVSWTHHNSNTLKLNELEASAKDFCHDVWIMQLNKEKHKGSAEYLLVEQSGPSCTISFSARNSPPSQHLLLHQVTLEVEKTEDLLENTQTKDQKSHEK